jgi:hypothetical protein
MQTLFTIGHSNLTQVENLFVSLPLQFYENRGLNLKMILQKKSFIEYGT